MRLVLVWLAAASTALIASGSTLSIAEARALRSSKTISNYDAAAEEEDRGSFKYTFDFDPSDLSALKRLNNDQFHRMATQPEYLKHIFKSWKSGFKPLEDYASFMESEGVSEYAIKHFIAAFKEYTNHRSL
ncbi:hypothetical protein L917_02909 [Phytophthora nicotianae]|uniref:RxLR effector protein n=1 Tax=Phytophthora nicotianae TaxID=4792 RepID=W2LUH7_PHYNI|nr:hypothetical protein L917_02909 [Phytophthora nicotianae]